MATIASCPKCSKQLGLPEEFDATDRAECPECRAIFSLSETTQISLPTVRVLDPAEGPIVAAAEVAESESATEGETSDALASNTAPLKSWEERLKNALAMDSSADTAPGESSSTETVGDQQEESKPSPSFEFELDPTPAASAEPKQPAINLELPEQPPTPQASADMSTIEPHKPAKTLADFAAKAEIPSINVESPKALELPEIINTSEGVEPQSTTAKEPAHIEPSGVAVSVQSVPARRVTRGSFPKIAAFVVGPMVGGFLGLYALLWLQGEKADYLGLSNVLPASLLPSASGELIAEAPPTETSSPSQVTKDDDSGSSLKRDEAVQPASATTPLPRKPPTVRINADEFSELVEQAAAAADQFVEGDLSTAAAIKRKGQAYMALCRLAEHFNFANQLGLAPAVQAKAKQAAQLFGQVTFKASVRQDLAHIAGRWWGYDQRPSNGIFFSGQVQDAEAAGGNTLCLVKLSDQSTVGAVPVLLAKQYDVGDQISVVGSIVADQAELPRNFSGNKLVRAEYTYALQVGQ